MAAVQDDVARGELYAYPIMRPPLTNSLSIVVLRDTVVTVRQTVDPTPRKDHARPRCGRNLAGRGDPSINAGS